MKLRRESEQLLIALVEDYQKQGGLLGPWDTGFVGRWAAEVGGFFPKDGANAAERYSEKDCYRAGSSLVELEYYQLIVLSGIKKPRPLGLGEQQKWLNQIGVHITPESIRYVEQLNHPWYRKRWDNIPSHLKLLIIGVTAVIIATLIMRLFDLV